MKENKFRVYCEFEFEGKLNKSMESSASWFLLTQTGKLWSYGPGEAPRALPKEYKKAIPLFYTGHKDKHGKEIFKGDIVRGTFYKGKPEISVVEWHEKSAGFTFFGYPLNIHGLHDIEIIGNIYMNPELLTGGMNAQRNKRFWNNNERG